MRAINGFIIFEPGETPAFPPGAPELPKIRSIFGLQLVEIEGKLEWMVNTKANFIESETRRLGDRDKAQEEANHREAHALKSCGGFPPNCRGLCCQPCNDRLNKSYYCACPVSLLFVDAGPGITSAKKGHEAVLKSVSL